METKARARIRLSGIRKFRAVGGSSVPRRLFLAAVSVLAASLLLLPFGCSRSKKASPAPAPVSPAPALRIVSLDPSVTESLFFLGLGGSIVARSPLCDFPPAAKEIPSVGGKVSVKELAALKPDYVFGTTSQEALKTGLDKAGLLSVFLRTQSLANIIDSLTRLGDLFECPETVIEWTAGLEDLLEVSRLPASVPPPRVLVCVGRKPGTLETLHVAGPESFYTDILGLLGATNACAVASPYAKISAEEVSASAPDIVVEIAPAVSDAEALRAQWLEAYPALPAARSGRVHVLAETWASRPGPRVGLLVNALSEILSGAAESGK